MKITNPSQQLAKVSGTQEVIPEVSADEAKVASAKSVQDGVDRVELSAEGMKLSRIQNATEIAMNTPDVDLEKVTAIKQSIAEGTYIPDMAEVAEKILEESNFFSRLS